MYTLSTIEYKLLLSTEIGSEESEEGMPRRGRQTRPNPEVASACDYWRVTITIPYLDSIISEMESRFAEDKRAHFELCALIPEVIREQDVQATCNILSSKWKHLLPEEGNFESELARWKVHCNGIFGERSITELLCQDADPIFFLNVRELLCILVVLPIGSAEAERSFSCLRLIQSWLRSTMTIGRLGNLGVLGIHGFDFPLPVDQICQSFTQMHHRKLCSESVLYE